MKSIHTKFASATERVKHAENVLREADDDVADAQEVLEKAKKRKHHPLAGLSDADRAEASAAYDEATYELLEAELAQKHAELDMEFAQNWLTSFTEDGNAEKTVALALHERQCEQKHLIDQCGGRPWGLKARNLLKQNKGDVGMALMFSKVV